MCLCVGVWLCRRIDFFERHFDFDLLSFSATLGAPSHSLRAVKHISYLQIRTLVIYSYNIYYPILWHIDLPVLCTHSATTHSVQHIASLFPMCTILYIDCMRPILIRMIDTQICFRSSVSFAPLVSPLSHLLTRSLSLAYFQ